MDHVDDWTGLWAGVTAVATVAAVLVTLATTFVLRFLDRSEADWITFDANTAWHEDSRGNVAEPHVSAELANVGDAAAHRVRVVGTGCQASFLRRNSSGIGSSAREVAARLGPGDELHLQVFCDPKVWDRAFLTITWIASPTRRQWSSRRAYVLRLRDVAEAPNYQGPHVQSEETGLVERTASEAPAGWRLPDRLAPQRQFSRGPQWLGRRLERARLRRRAR